MPAGLRERAADRLPRQGMKGPWRNPQNYAFDIFRFRFGAIKDNVLEFRRARNTMVRENSPAAIVEAKLS